MRMVGLKWLGAALLSTLAWHGPARANEVTEWSVFAAQVLGSTAWQAGREPYALAMVQAAVFDAVDAIHPRYLPYRSGVRAPAGASDVAAVAEAARRVLRSLAPDQAPQIDAKRDEMVARLDPAARAKGLDVGTQAARAILADRLHDGAFWAVANDTGLYVPAAAEPADDAPLPLLGIDRGRPFVLNDVNQFLPAPPPPLNSPQHERDLAETLRLGEAESVVRTPDQSRTAQFHVRAGVSPWSDIARQAANRNGLDLVDTARLLALVALSVADCLSAGTEAKYTYLYIRPDKAALSIGRIGWSPAIGTPGTPEYPCQHCATGSAGQEAIEAVVGSGPLALTVTSLFSHETRFYGSPRAYAEEEAMSRIYGGVHYRWSNIIGSALGKQVAHYVVSTVAVPLARASGG